MVPMTCCLFPFFIHPGHISLPRRWLGSPFKWEGGGRMDFASVANRRVDCLLPPAGSVCTQKPRQGRVQDRAVQVRSPHPAGATHCFGVPRLGEGRVGGWLEDMRWRERSAFTFEHNYFPPSNQNSTWIFLHSVSRAFFSLPLSLFLRHRVVSSRIFSPPPHPVFQLIFVC